MARARLQEKEEETEIKIFNEHKDRIKKLMAQKQMVSSKMFQSSLSHWLLCLSINLIG